MGAFLEDGVLGAGEEAASEGARGGTVAEGAAHVVWAEVLECGGVDRVG